MQGATAGTAGMMSQVVAMKNTTGWRHCRHIAVGILLHWRWLLLAHPFLTQLADHLLDGPRCAAHDSLSILQYVLPSAAVSRRRDSGIYVLHDLALHVGGHGVARNIRHLIRTDGTLEDESVIGNPTISHGQEELLGVQQAGLDVVLKASRIGLQIDAFVG